MGSLLLAIYFVVGQSPEPHASVRSGLASYFAASDSKTRERMASEIAQESRFEEVLFEIRQLDLWSGQSPSEQRGNWVIDLPSGRSVTATFALPQNYVTTKAFPLVVALKSNDRPPGQPDLNRDDYCDDCIWVELDEPVGGPFHMRPAAASDLPSLLRDIRRKIRVDSDRVYLFGEGSGADWAWVAAMMYPHELAGIVVVSGMPRIPYPEQSYPLLIPNLRQTPFVSVWVGDSTGQPASTLAAVNKAIADFALAAGMSFDTATLAASSADKISIPHRVVDAALSKPRTRAKECAIWFRYLPQGNLGWLRATELAGDVWDDEQISIVATAEADRDQFIRNTLRSKLFFLSGRVNGQKIVIETQRLEGVELELPPELIDLSKAITIEINGRVRFEGILEPSISSLLESVYESWDFQNLVHARKRFSIHAS